MKKLIMTALVIVMGLGIAATAIQPSSIVNCDKDDHDDDEE